MELVVANLDDLRAEITHAFERRAAAGPINCGLAGGPTALIYLAALREAQVDWSQVTFFMAKASLPVSDTRVPAAAERRAASAVVVPYERVSRAARSNSPSLKGFDNQRQPVSSRNRSASVPATSPVTKITRRASAGVAAAIAR